MSRILYQLAITGYSFLLKGLAPFHPKARLMVQGRRALFNKIEAALAGNQHPVAWFHCASLGEFEQGRPLMEQFSRLYPEYRIVLTFFSPSGYEVRKNYAGAHQVFYLVQVVLVPRGKIVEPRHTLVQAQQCFDQVGTDKTGRAGHQPVVAVLAQVLLDVLNLFHGSEHFLFNAFRRVGNAATDGGIAHDNTMITGARRRNRLR